MYLAADIGGTKTHIAIYKENLQRVKDQKYASHDYQDLETIIKDFLSDVNQPIDRACFGIAGPIKDGVCETTNLPWIVDSKKIESQLKIKEVVLINDLRANAYGLKVLKKEDFFILNEGKPEKGNQALISAGTGLGEAGIYFDGEKHHPFSCEGGHCDFAPRNDLEIQLLQYLMKKYTEHVSYERILSGQGLYDLYCFLIDTKQEEPCKEVQKEVQSQDPPKVISEVGVKKQCKACERALELFCDIYGSESGNTALKFYAINGIFLGGGIAPKILSVLKDSFFLKSFSNKGRFKDLLSQIPIKIVLNDETALLGAAYYCLNVHQKS